MDSLLISVQVVFPLFIFMVIGYYFKFKNIWDDYSINIINNIVLKYLLPVLIFVNITKSELDHVIELKYLGFIGLGIISLFILLVIIIPIIEKENSKRGVLIQGIMRSNFASLGLPIATYMCGELELFKIVIITIVVVPLYNILGVLSLEIYRKDKISWNKILINIIKNPLIIASFSGVIFLVLKIEMLQIMNKVLLDISRMVAPLSVMVLGGNFHLKHSKLMMKPLAIGILGRLIVAPAIFIILGIILGFRDIELIGIMVVFASPHSISSYTMAKQMGGDSDLAGQLIVISTALSIVTIFCWIFILKYLNFV